MGLLISDNQFSGMLCDLKDTMSLSVVGFGISNNVNLFNYKPHYGIYMWYSCFTYFMECKYSYFDI